MIYGVGTPSKIRQAGTMYTDKRTGIIYIQNASPSGNAWSPLDNDVTDDSTGGPGGTFSGGTVTNATNFLSTISSGGTNIGNLFVAKAGDTMSGTLNAPIISATTYSGTTYISGSTNISNLFARISHTHAIGDVNNLQSELNLKAPTNAPEFTGSILAGTTDTGIPVNIYGTLSATTLNVFGLKGKVKVILENYTVDSDSSLELDFTIISSGARDNTITLPEVENGRILIINNANDMAGFDTIITPPAETLIDNQVSLTITGGRKSVIIQYVETLTAWYVLALR